MNTYYNTLELHKILEMLAGQASNQKTKEMALSLVPLTDIYSVKKELDKTADAFNLSVKFGTPSFYNFKDVSASLLRAKAGSSLSLRELLDIAQLLNQTRLLTDWYKQCSGIETSLSPIFNSLIANKHLEEKITSAILSEEEIADDASPELLSIRRKIIQSGAKIREHLDKMLHSSSIQKCLQESIITIRDGRYVLPVKAEHKNSVNGLVHDTSSSGSTLFIEPLAVVETNNDIRILKGREQEEIERIISELSSECGDNADSIISDFEICAELNLYFSKSNLAAKMKASVPELSDDGRVILNRARHPLLDEKKAVPISLTLGYDYQTLIITGPNTGGKTVVLKTLGLLTLMTMCGLMIPASDGSRISVFSHVLADIGDQQSIENSLSTFSSHINRVVDILNTSTSNSLVLLDELGSGTDPVEGAALAISILKKLNDIGSKVVITTHYQELKMYAVQTENVENASCEFDVATLQPTYRLIIGSPGKSNAFEISQKLGISPDVIDYAKELVSSENIRFEEVIEQLEKSRFELEEKNREVAKLKTKIEEDSKKLQNEIDELKKNKEFELEKARQQAMSIIENVRNQSDELIDELTEIRKQKEKENFSQLSISAKTKAKSSLNKMYEEANPVVKNTNSGYKLPRPLKKGDHVYICDIDKNGIVAGEPDSNGSVFVQAGIMKTKVSIDKLRLIDEPKITFKNKKISAKGVTRKADRSISMDIDIRGKNVDEGIHEVGMFIDNAVLSSLGMITIIHGKGTGLLRSGIHKYLKTHPSVKSFRLGVYGEGEDGVTIVELK
ncbi:MAG TPA: endonuclease MutS2 [Oscillospiraceae bacterium]|nr:endonuclease MutS2 [Oscillospiraceae bacterium]